MSGVFTWLVAQWEHDRRPLVYFAFLQLGLAIWFVGTEAGAFSVWIVTPDLEKPMSEQVGLSIRVTSLALAIWFAIRDFKAKTQALQPVTVRDRVRALIARSVAAAVLVSLIYGAALVLGRMSHGYLSTGMDSRGWDVFAGALTGLIPFVLYASLSLLPVSPSGAVRLAILVGYAAIGGSLWFMLPAFALAVWALYGLEHDPDAPVRPRRVWPCAVALGLFALSVESCSYKGQADIQADRMSNEFAAAVELQMLVEDGDLDHAWFRTAEPLSTAGSSDRRRLRSIEVSPDWRASNSALDDWTVLRLTDGGDLEILRRPLYRSREIRPHLHRYEAEGGLRFGRGAWIERHNGEHLVVEPGRTEFFRVQTSGEVWPPKLERIPLPSGEVLEGFSNRVLSTIWPQSITAEVNATSGVGSRPAKRIVGRGGAYTWTAELGWVTAETVARPQRFLEWGPLESGRRTATLKSDQGEALAQVQIAFESHPLGTPAGAITTPLRPIWMPLAALFVGADTLPWVDRWVRQEPWAVIVPVLVTGVLLGLVYLLLNRPWIDRRRIRFWLGAVLIGGPWVAAIGNVFEDERAHGEPARGPLRAPRLRLRSGAESDLQEVSA